MEQMEHPIKQIVMNINSWNRLEQNGTNTPFSIINGTNGTINKQYRTFKTLIF